jgi:hypothetical protein
MERATGKLADLVLLDADPLADVRNVRQIQSVSGAVATMSRRAMPRFQLTFAALVLAQAAHSVEEYVGRLWETFPPAAFVSGLVSSDREHGFLVLNCLLVIFGVWCLVWPVRRAWPKARAFVWLWVGVEVVNGIGHPIWSLRQGSYTPGVLTAPILLALALSLVLQLSSAQRPVSLGERNDR